MARERAEYYFKLAFNLLRLLSTYENMGKEAGMYELVDALETNYHTLQRVIRALEAQGLVEVVPREKKNVPKLTDRGRCLARCLVS